MSPFLDGGTVRELGRWGSGDTRRTIVSSRGELAKLAHQQGKPLSGYQDLLVMDAPASAQQAPAVDVDNGDKAQDEEPERRSLHAKLIYAEEGDRRTLWIGSANATARAWQGPNTEVVAEMVVSESLAAALKSFVNEKAMVVKLEEMSTPPTPDPIEERLEEARKEVVRAWIVTQRINSDGCFIWAKIDPNPIDGEIELRLGPLYGGQVQWPRGDVSVRIGPHHPEDVTELIRCTLRLGDTESSWLMRAPLDPAPGEERDRRALSRFLDVRTFLAWIRSLLTDDPMDTGGGDWSEPAYMPKQYTAQDARPDWWAPTIEDVLGAWSRNPESLRIVDKRITQYLKLYEEQQGADVKPEERKTIDEFRETWQVLRKSLIAGAE